MQQHLKPNFPDFIRAISTSAPHAYLICTGEKEAEYRRWPTKLRDTIILIHSYSSDRFDYLFKEEDIPEEKCPKRAILGAATIVGCEWDFEYQQYAHIYEDPILFKKPIRDVPGARNYWTPRNDQQHWAFQKAIAILKQII